MPYNALTTRTNAASLIPEAVAREIIQSTPEQSAVLRLGRRLPDMSSSMTRMPVLDVLPTAYFVSGDTGLKQTTNLAWKDKFLYAEEIAVVVPVPEAVIMDSSYDLWAEVRPRIVEAFGVTIDKAVIHGTAKPANWPDGLVVQAAAAGNTVDLSVVLGGIAPNNDLYYAILGDGQLFAKVETDGFQVTGSIAALEMKGKLRNVRDTTGQPIFNRITGMQGRTTYELDGTPIEFPRNGAIDPAVALMVSGDFDQLVWSVRQDMTFKVFAEGVITDNTGAIIYNLMQQDMVALRCVMRLAWQVPNPMNRVNSTEATRFPFAALVP